MTTTSKGAITVLPELLDHSVQEHLISDVPVGLFLSSGLDSTIIAGLAAKHHPSIRAFTVSFTDEPEFDESDHAALSAKRFRLPFEKIPITAAEAEASVMDWLAAVDQPSIEGFNTYLISRAVRARGIKVALSGQGGDELFGGYPSFSDVARLKRYHGALKLLPVGIRQAAASFATLGKSGSVRSKLRDMVCGSGNVVDMGLQRRRLMNNQQLMDFGFDYEALNLTPNFQEPSSIPDMSDVYGDVTTTISRLESIFYQGNMLLRDGDANSMAHGLEVRMPFLDQRLLNTVHSWPGTVRTPSGKPPKYLLRTAFADLLDPSLLKLPKRGFVLPIRRWMRTTLKASFDTAIDTLRSSRLLKVKVIDNTVENYLNEPESPAWSRAFALFSLGDFLHRHAQRITA